MPNLVERKRGGESQCGLPDGIRQTLPRKWKVKITDFDWEKSSECRIFEKAVRG